MPRTEHEVRLLRSSMFIAQAMARDMIAARRDQEVEEIRDLISEIVPDVDTNRPVPHQSGKPINDPEGDDS